jgi:hypothetical protein
MLIICVKRNAKVDGRQKYVRKEYTFQQARAIHNGKQRAVSLSYSYRLQRAHRSPGN